jgi:hypothetical protein
MEARVSLLPRHRVSRRIAAAWLFVCFALLVVTLARVALHEGDRSALNTLVPLYWLSLPLGHAGIMAVIDIRTALYVSGTVPGLLVEGLASWLALTTLGYAQWFLLLPLVARGFQKVLQLLFNRDATPGAASQRAKSALSGD